MRGKVPLVTSIAIVIGITPAYAGKRDSGKQQGRRKRDHPRLCGEKSHTAYTKGFYKGSPPPMRGKGAFFPHLFSTARITPAYAGKRRLRLPRVLGRRDHPRLCGEKQMDDAHQYWEEGSPPPMRGKDGSDGSKSRQVRITPAYAGKSQAPSVPLVP